MPREVVSLHVGQCGNQIGTEFWRTLCREHAIGHDGKLDASPTALAQGPDCREVFFYEGDDGRYIPRALLIDLEPRVINAVQTGELRRLFNPEGMFLSAHGGGAGNNWASGFHQAEASEDTILELLDREARNCDSLQGFQLTHSIAGGTGSGMGSWLLETLSDHYPKATIHAYSVFPNADNESGLSDTVVQPYNSVLTLKRLAQDCSAAVVLDNTALDAIAMQHLGIAKPTVEEGNSLVSTVMAAASAPYRFPGRTGLDMQGLTSSLAASPTAHLLTASYNPIKSARQSSSAVVRTTVKDVMQRLVDRRNATVQPPGSSAALRDARYIKALTILQGDVDCGTAGDAAARLHRPSGSRGVPAMRFSHAFPPYLGVTVARASPHVAPSHRVSGLLLGNHTGVRHTLERTLAQFDRLMERKAFVREYEKFPMFSKGAGRAKEADLTEFADAREVVASLAAEYRSYEVPPEAAHADEAVSPAALASAASRLGIAAY